MFLSSPHLQQGYGRFLHPTGAFLGVMVAFATLVSPAQATVPIELPDGSPVDLSPISFEEIDSSEELTEDKKSDTPAQIVLSETSHAKRIDLSVVTKLKQGIVSLAPFKSRKKKETKTASIRIQPTDMSMLEPEFLDSLSSQELPDSKQDITLRVTTNHQHYTTAGALAFQNPVPGTTFSSGFGLRHGRPHRGVDLAGPIGTRISAAASGRVIHAGWESGYGKTIILDHGKVNGRHYKTRYAHMSRFHVQVGDTVPQGTLIGNIGMTGRTSGPHLHFEVLVNNQHRDPMTYINRGPVLALHGQRHVGL